MQSWICVADMLRRIFSFESKFKNFVTVQISFTRAFPPQVTVETMRSDIGIRGATQEKPGVTLTPEVCDDELKEALAKPPVFFLLKQGQHHNFASLRRAKAVAYKSLAPAGRPTRQAAGSDVFCPRL